MEVWEKEIVEKNIDKLVKETICNISLLSKLQASGIISEEEVDNLKSLKDNIKQAYDLYSILCKRENSFENLLEALHQTRQSGALAILRNGVNRRLRSDTVDDLKSIKYDKKSVLGEGSLQTLVYKGEFGGRTVAVKRVKTDSFGGNGKLIDNEIEVLKACDRHENIVQCFGSKNELNAVLIILEMCDMTLKEWVARKDIEIAPVEVIRQVTVGLSWLHEQNIVHRDLKPENILLTRRPIKVKLADFGMSRSLVDGRTYVSAESAIGTKGWIAPEVLNQMLPIVPANVKCTTASDIFALGCVYYYVLTDGKNCFGDWVRSQANILDGKFSINHEDVQHGCKQNILLVRMMVSVDPNSRPPCSQLLSWPIFWSVSLCVRFLQNLKTKLGEKIPETLNKNRAVVACPYHDNQTKAGLELLQGTGCRIPSAYLQFRNLATNMDLHSAAPAESSKTQSDTTAKLNSEERDKNSFCFHSQKTETKEFAINSFVRAAQIPTTKHTEASMSSSVPLQPKMSLLSQRTTELIENLKQAKGNMLIERAIGIVKTEDLTTIKAVFNAVGKKRNLLDIRTGEPKSILHAAVAIREFDVIDYLLHSMKFDKAMHEDRFRDDHTLIHTCINNIHNVKMDTRFDQKVRILQLLLSICPELIESKDCYGQTILHNSLRYVFKTDRKTEFIQILLNWKSDCNAKCYKGRTALHFACMIIEKVPTYALITHIQLLLKNNADPNLVDSDGNTFLMAAAYNQNISADQFHELVAYLQSTGITDIFHVPNNFGQTLLSHSVKCFEPINETLKVFKTNGVDFNAATINGDRAINLSIRHQRTVSCIKTLVEFGADFKAVNKYKDTVLHSAAFDSRNLSALSYFLELGCNVNAQTIDGDTPLHVALKMSNNVFSHEIVKKLVKHGANANLRNKKGELPIDLVIGLLKSGKLQQKTFKLLKH